MCRTKQTCRSNLQIICRYTLSSYNYSIIFLPNNFVFRHGAANTANGYNLWMRTTGDCKILDLPRSNRYYNSI